MPENPRDSLIFECKSEIQDHPLLTAMDESALMALIEQKLDEKTREASDADPQRFAYLSSLNFRERQGILKSIYDSIRGMDILGRIMADKSVSEIMINGYDHIFIERDGQLSQLPDRFESKERLSDLIIRFVQAAGRSVSESNPIVDTRLEDGSRVNVVMPPVALNGPIVTIRRFPEKPFTMERLIEIGSLTPEAADFLEKLVRAKYNIFVSGGTGSGKTTFLNALSNYIPKYERIITIEDSAELQIKGIDNLVRLETRSSTDESARPITIRDLIKSSLRMRPERIVVGEVRGPEALDMLQAMNTGHDGSLSTGHANSSKDMLSRLETMVLSGSAGLPLDAVRQQITSAVDVIIHLGRLRDFSRKTLEISEFLGYENDKPVLNPLFRFEEEPDSTNQKVLGSLRRTRNAMVQTEKFVQHGIYDFLDGKEVRP